MPPKKKGGKPERGKPLTRPRRPRRETQPPPVAAADLPETPKGPGPGVNEDLLERCVVLRLAGRRWTEVSDEAGVPYSTLMDWRKRPEWEHTRTRILLALPDSILYLARVVYHKRLLADLAAAKPDIETAREVLAWFRAAELGEHAPATGDLPIVATAVSQQVILLPAQTQGQPSRSAAEALKQSPFGSRSGQGAADVAGLPVPDDAGAAGRTLAALDPPPPEAPAAPPTAAAAKPTPAPRIIVTIPPGRRPNAGAGSGSS